MFNLRENTQTLIIVALGTALSLTLLASMYAIEDREEELSLLRETFSNEQKKTAALTISNMGLKASIKESNLKLEAIEVDYDKAILLYKKQLEKPPDVRYEVIYKYIDREVAKSGECNDIKNVLNSLSNIDYNDL